MSGAQEVLTMAICLFPMVTPLDYQGPVELFGFLAPEIAGLGILSAVPKVALQATYLAPTKEPVKGTSGPLLLPDKSYAEAEGTQFDIIIVPGGIGTAPGVLPTVVLDFLRKQAPGAKYVLSICTGSEILAAAGLLDGRRATSNKSSYKVIKDRYRELNVEWVPKARWVVDGNIWTSSGVTAGADMGYAFLLEIVGSEVAENIRGIVELGIHQQDDDEFAEFWKLV